jgi:hypothetical protein
VDLFQFGRIIRPEKEDGCDSSQRVTQDETPRKEAGDGLALFVVDPVYRICHLAVCKEQNGAVRSAQNAITFSEFACMHACMHDASMVVENLSFVCLIAVQAFVFSQLRSYKYPQTQDYYIADLFVNSLLGWP